MPTPMMAPMPKETRFQGPKARRKECSPSAASANTVSIDLTVSRLMRPSVGVGASDRLWFSGDFFVILREIRDLHRPAPTSTLILNAGGLVPAAGLTGDG